MRPLEIQSEHLHPSAQNYGETSPGFAESVRQLVCRRVVVHQRLKLTLPSVLVVYLARRRPTRLGEAVRIMNLIPSQ